MTSGRKTRLYRLVVDTWPTPDGAPFDRQPAAAYVEAINWNLAGLRTPAPHAWMAGIEWNRRVQYFASDAPAEPGVWFACDGVRFTVPAHRRQHFLSPTAARKALAALQAWGAHGHIETSDPITWKGGA